MSEESYHPKPPPWLSVRGLDGLILCVAGFLVILLIQRFFRPSYPARVPLPALLAIGSDKGTVAGVGSDRVSPPTRQQVEIAEACLIEGSRLKDHGNDSKALDWFRRAYAAAPGDPRYENALRIMEERTVCRDSLALLARKLEQGNADEAWSEYLQLSLENRRFFLDTACPWAFVLERKGFVASAASVLRTHLTLKPADIHSGKSLERLLSKLGCRIGDL